MKTLGILGGMGPLAGAYFYSRVIAHTAADADRGHIPVLLLGDPRIPDRTAHLLGRGESPLRSLRNGIKMLEQMGAEVISIPCNTAHAYFTELDSTVPILDMPSLAIKVLYKRGVYRLGLLSTRGTLRAGIYLRAASKMGMELIVPSQSDSELLDYYIHREKAGCSVPKENYMALGAALGEKGADAVLLGCTELSTAFGGVYPAWMCDALEVLAQVSASVCGAPLRAGVGKRDLCGAVGR